MRRSIPHAIELGMIETPEPDEDSGIEGISWHREGADVPTWFFAAVLASGGLLVLAMLALATAMGLVALPANSPAPGVSRAVPSPYGPPVGFRSANRVPDEGVRPVAK